MYLLNKTFHPVNFAFARATADLSLSVRRIGDGVHHLEIRDPALWPTDYRAMPMAAEEDFSGAAQNFKITRDAGLQWRSTSGDPLLRADGGHWFGRSGASWLFRFDHSPEMRFYGLGEKQAPFERSGRTYRFWNVDVWADLPMERAETGDYDPDYIAIPYLIIRRGGHWIGLLMDNPFPGAVGISPKGQVAEQLKVLIDYPPSIFIGAENGIASLYCLYAPGLRELTCKFQTLTGKTPLPPLWALGYHQSRWGYKSHADLNGLADAFIRHRFPADGLWLDIDYMDGFKVFTFDKTALPRPEETTARLREKGFRAVPILDPGVKREPGYAVYESGRAADVFCRNPAGSEFVGMVWPGLTVFPDFSLPEARRWWADHARGLFEKGFDGAWIDMNDPSTGPIDPTAMRFARGAADHEAYHNAYATLMARATAEGFAAARPGQRPFLLSRSGTTGAQRYAAHWTGDNFSNYFHLRRSIGRSLNLALSGIPFNGPDVGGFGGDCPENLLVDWIKAAFLFPLLRNHTMRGSRSQEPWAYSEAALGVIRHFVRLRYHLMPYLYNLFIAQSETGEAILRPLFYDFPSADFDFMDDQLMVGPAVLQAPFVDERGAVREVVLPPCRWLRADTGGWIPGGRRIRAARRPASTPLFLRDGYLIPFQPGKRVDNRVDLNRIGLLCCLSPGFDGVARYRHCADDGISLNYRAGTRSVVELAARVEKNTLYLTTVTAANGFGPISVNPYTVNRFSRLILQTDGEERALRPEKEKTRMSGGRFFWWRWV